MANNKAPSYKRRNFMVNPEFQLTVIGFFCGLALVTVSIFFWSTKMIFHNFFEQAQSMGLPPNHVVVLYLQDNAKAMDRILITTSVLLFLFLTIGGLILSHQIAGPIYRLRKHIQQVSSGNSFGDLSFRKKDFFQEIVTDYNQMLVKVREWRDR